MSKKTKFEKDYFGSGKKVDGMNIVKCSVNVAELAELVKKHKYEYRGEEYFTFEVAERKKPDDYGKTHYLAVSYVPEEAKAVAVEDDVPF